jgi:transmembrane sensor
MFSDKPKNAAEWMVRISAGKLSDQDQRSLEIWLAQKPENKAALEKARQLWSLSAQLRNSATARSLLASAESPSPSQRVFTHRTFGRYLATAAAAAAAIVVIFSGLPRIEQFLSSPKVLRNGGAATSRGENANYTLADGSRLTLSAATTVRIAFNDKERIVFLTGGEGFFDVKHNPDRPFIVIAGKRRVVVAGTKFNVDYLPDQSDMAVAVVEGLVNVTYPTARAGNQTIPIKQDAVIQFPANGSAVRRPISPARASAWREGKLYFDDAPLSEVLASVNRYSSKPLMVSNPEMQKLTVTGMFRAGDLKAVLMSLNDLYGVKSKELADRWLLTPDSNPASPN